MTIKNTALILLKTLSATNRLEEMKKNISSEDYVIQNMALSGQITLFYGRPGCGKTLFILAFLLLSIKNKRITSEYLFYINADDNYKGNYVKSQVAAEFGFSMISPSESNIESDQVIQLLVQMASEDIAPKVVIVLDTLKKFADMMNKKSQSVFFSWLRKITSKGGTVIIAGHANKNNDAEGKLIYEGTSDTMNDIDCAYSMQKISLPEDETQIIEFLNQKDRGDVIQKVSFKFLKQKGISYQEMLKSVTPVDALENKEINVKSEQQRLKNKYESEILFITGLLKTHGDMKQIELIEALKNGSDLSSEITNTRLRAALNDKGLSTIFWTTKRAEHNAKVYSLIDNSSLTKELFS